jgi:membrane protease YdiL (CAAX protease family)
MTPQIPVRFGPENFLGRHPVSIYFALTFAVSWSGALAMALPHLLRGEAVPKFAGPMMFPAMLLGPSVVGVALTRIVDGSNGMRDLFSRMHSVGFPLRWYAALLVPPALVLTVLLCLKACVSPVFAPNCFLIGISFGFFAGFFEEIGWMGFAFPKMHGKDNVLASAILLGLLWGAWHIPVCRLSRNLHTPRRLLAPLLKILAARTGGKAYYGTNGLSDAMRHALEDSRMTYTLGYYPVGVKWDGSFHNIKVGVKTLRAEVRARSGYFAIPDATKIPPKSLQNIISQTAVNNLDATGIGMRVQLHPATDSGTQTLTAQVHLDLHEIHMDQNDGLWTGAIQSVFLQLSKQGEILHADDETYQLSLPPAVYQQTLVSGLRNTKRIHVLPGATQFCVVLRDPSNGNMGSLSIPITKYFPASKSGNPARTP